MSLMAQKKNPTDRSRDRHKPRRTIAFPPRMYDALVQLAAQNDRPINREAHRIVRKALEEAGLWPPPGDHPPKTDESADS